MAKGLRSRIGTILNGTASGLIPMAIFTPVYAIWLVLAWLIPGLILLILAAAWSLCLALTAARLLRLSRELPHATNADDDPDQ